MCENEDTQKIKQERDKALKILQDVLPTIIKIVNFDESAYDIKRLVVHEYWELKIPVLAKLEKMAEECEIEGIEWMQ